MYSSLNQLNYDVPQKISLHSLMLLMLQESCNTATRIILNRIGDTEAVDVFLKSNGITEIGKDYYTMESFAEFEGITDLPKKCSLEEFNRLAAKVPLEELNRAREKLKAELSHSETSTATPRAMTTLLIYLFKGKLISNESAKLIFSAMRRCRTGPQRMMGMLPPKTPVAHKTGSLTGYTCDIGLITLPNNAGHIALSVYLKDWTSSLVIAERTIAEATRSIYDVFLLN